jgi:hypothetical protein
MYLCHTLGRKCAFVLDVADRVVALTYVVDATSEVVLGCGR